MQVTSEGPVRITKATIETAWRRRRSGFRLIVRDQHCRGLALIVNAGSMTWSYAYRPRGLDPKTNRRWANRTITLGNPATHSPDAARAEANRLKGQLAAGVDPGAERKAAIEAALRQRANTLGRLLDDYALALPKRPKLRGPGFPSAEYVADELAQVRMALAAMGVAEMAAKDLEPADIRRLVENMTNARARFSALSRFLDWCQELGHIASNPCVLLPRSRRPKAPQARAHYLTIEELARLWLAANGLREAVWRDLARFLIAIPCRRGEAARMDWSHLDFNLAGWHQPGKLTKTRDPHRLHLHPLVLALLRARHAAAGRPKGGLVFPAPESGKAVDTFSDLKNKLSAAAGLSNWTWHDFRRSFATALGEAGIPESVADAVLNHRQSATRGGVLGVYQRASRWPEQVRAMQLWGRLLAEAIEGSDGEAKVVAFSHVG